MLPRLTTVTTIALALCACGLVPVARGLAADRPLVVGVFGGSTSVGGGDPATPAHALWHAVAADMLQGVTGRSVQVVNHARGATDADFYSSCFDRFDPPQYDVVLLEFAINGGNVDELVSVAHAKTHGALIVLVNLFSCNDARSGAPSDVERGPLEASFDDVAHKHGLINIRLNSWSDARLFNPCQNDTRTALFKADAHHLSDAGHAVLGRVVARRLAEVDFTRLDEVHSTLHHHARHSVSRRHHGGENTDHPARAASYVPVVDAEPPPNTLDSVDTLDTTADSTPPAVHTNHAADLMCAMAGDMLGTTPHDLATSFDGAGWTYSTDVPGRPDKACWLTTQPRATLASKGVLTETYSQVDLFLQFSNRLQGTVAVGCAGASLGSVNTTWDPLYTVIRRHTFAATDASAVCRGPLEITATNGVGTDGVATVTKVCGVVVKG